MAKGFYSLAFYNPETEEETLGGGVLIMKDGKLYGGDGSSSYQGDYRLEEGGFIVAKVKVSLFNNFDQSIFSGMQPDINFKVAGTLDANGFSAKARIYTTEQVIKIKGTLISII